MVIDDNQTNLNAAISQLKAHDVSVLNTYESGEKMVCNNHNYEVVLVDLLMSASGKKQGPKGIKFIGEEIPIGIFLALLAAKNGAKYVAVFTDIDHHSHPSSACFDAFNKRETKPTIFSVNKAKFMLSNNRNWVNNFKPDNLAKEMNFEEWREQKKPSESERKIGKNSWTIS